MNVRFFAGSKSQYLEIAKHNPVALYFCHDTRELFWGDKLLSDGIRVFQTKKDLPEFDAAADGIIYYVADTRSGYVLSADRSEWLQVIYAPTADITIVPEGEAQNTAVSVAALREVENTIYEKIASIDNLNKIKTISFAGVVLDRADGVFSIDRDAALKALGISFAEGPIDTATKVVTTKAYVDSKIAAMPEVDLSKYAEKADLAGLATEEFVKKAIIEAELDDKEVDLSAYYTKSEVDKLIPDTSNFVTGTKLEDFVRESIEGIEFPEPDFSGLATKEEIADLATTKYVDEKVGSIKVPTKVSDLENDAGYLTEHQDLSAYAKTDFVNKTTVAQKYEVLPVDGMLVSYRENEVRINTEHVVPVKQPVGETGNPNMYYVTFRAYAPEGATGVIESDGTQTDAEPTTLAVDAYGRSYATIWSAIANYNGTEWTKWGDKSTLDKYLGFYYTFKWFKDDQLLETDKVRVILTNDACHDDLVPDAVARRIDEKFKAIDIPEVNLDGYATEAYVDEKIAAIETHEAVTKVSELENDAGFITAADIADKADKDHTHDYAATEHEHEQYLTEQSLVDYAKTEDLFSKDYNDLANKPEIPNVDNFITMEQVEAKNYLTEVPAEFVTEPELAAKGYITEHQSLAGLATEDFVKNAIAEAELNDKDVDISGLATKDEIKNLASVSYVDEKVAEIEVPANVSAFINDAGYLTAHQDLSEYAKKSDIPTDFLTTIPDEYITESELAAELAKIEHPTVSLDGYATEAWVNEQGFIKEHQDLSHLAEKDHEHEQYLTEHQSLDAYAKKDELFSGSYNDLTDKPEIPSIEGLASTEYVDNAIAGIEIPEPEKVDLTGYAKLTDIPDVSKFIEEVPAEYITEDELNDKGYITSLTGYATEDYVGQQIEAINLSEYAKIEDIPTDYLTEADLAGYSKFSGSYNDLTDTPEIPSVDGLASESYVDEAVKNITVDTSNLATIEQLNAKANDILFTESKIVKTPVGGFVADEDVNGLTIAQLFAKLLGLADKASGSIVDKILENSLAMYSVTTDGELARAEFKVLDGNAAPTESGFFVIRDENGEIEKAGYQDLSVVSDELYYIIALPKELDYNTMVALEAWDSEEKVWVESDMHLISEPSLVAGFCDEIGVDISGIDQNAYTIWVYEDVCTGSILRYVIKEQK